MPSFPALDEEPPPLSWWRRLLPAAVVLVAVLAAGLLWRSVDPGSAPPQAGGAPGPTGSPAANPGPDAAAGGIDLPGRVLVARAPGGELAYATLSGLKNLAGAPLDGSSAKLTSAGDLVTRGGDIAHVKGTVLSSPASVIPAGRLGQLEVTFHPWADRGRRLVLIAAGGGHADVELVDRRGRHVQSLGTDAVDAAGDPSRPGALVTVAGKLITDPNSQVLQDTGVELAARRLELRRPGRRPTAVVTTVGLAAMAGLPRGHYFLTAWFSPNGQHISVLAKAADAGKSLRAVVVLSRGGTPEVAVRASRFLSGGWWSPDSKTFVYAVDAAGDRRARVVVIDVANTRHPRWSVDLPGGVRYIGRCVWSPDGSQVLCAGAGSQWVLLDPAARTARPVQPPLGRLDLVAWLPGGGA